MLNLLLNYNTMQFTHTDTHRHTFFCEHTIDFLSWMQLYFFLSDLELLQLKLSPEILQHLDNRATEWVTA